MSDVSALTALLLAAAAASVGQTHALLIHVLPTALTDYSDRVVEQRLDWPSHSAKLQQRGRFRRYYRMPLGKFNVLAAALRANERSFLATGAQHGVTWATAPFPAELRLSMTLCYLAGGSYMDIALLHGCSFNAIHKLVDRTLKVLNELPQLDNMHFDSDIASEPRRAAGCSLAASVRWMVFSSRSNAPASGATLAASRSLTIRSATSAERASTH